MKKNSVPLASSGLEQKIPHVDGEKGKVDGVEVELVSKDSAHHNALQPAKPKKTSDESAIRYRQYNTQILNSAIKQEDWSKQSESESKEEGGGGLPQGGATESMG